MTMTAENLDQVRPISHGVNEKGHVTVGGIDVEDLVKEFGSPLYVMCEETIRARTKAYEKAFEKYYPNHLSLFASKSFNCKAMCKLMEQENFGLDVVSGGELHTALSAKFPAEKIFLHGNNKLEDELELAIDNEIGGIVLDNFYELDLIEKIAKANSKKPKIRLMIRVTPGIECHTHEYIKTGTLDSKFGFNIDDLDKVLEKILAFKKSYENVDILGLHCHIGSQIFELDPHHDTGKVMLELYKNVKDKFGLEFPDLNIGGGLGIMYTESDDPPSIDTWVKTVTDSVKKHCTQYSIKEPRILIEPGRSMVGPAGLTLYKVGNIKDIPGIRTYVSVDGGMADNVRPIMYQAEYTIEVANKANDKKTEKITLAGRYCESGDVIAKDIQLAKVEKDDLIVVYSTGAYNYSMASNYNRTTRPAVVIVKNGVSEIIVNRESYEDIVRLDRIPASWS